MSEHSMCVAAGKENLLKKLKTENLQRHAANCPGTISKIDRRKKFKNHEVLNNCNMMAAIKYDALFDLRKTF